MSSTLKLQYDFINSPGLAAHNGIGPTLDITRATTATFLDQDSILRTAAAGEARFTGARRVENFALQSEDFSTTWASTAVTVSTNVSATTDPIGGNAADKLIEDSDVATAHFVEQSSLTITDGQTATASVYVKAEERSAIRFVFTDATVASFEATFTLTGGGVIRSGPSDAGNWTGTSAAISSEGNGWYRITLTGSLSVGQTVCALQFFLDDGSSSTYNGDGTSGFYLWGAQLENVSGQLDPSPSEYIATTAAAVANVFTTDKDGEDLVASRPGLLVEEARTNICLQSEDLSTSWTNNADSLDDQNAGVAPDGANTANRLKDDNAGGTGTPAITSASITVAVSTAHVYSCYVKADGLDWVRLNINGAGALVINAFFDLTNGVVGATTGANNTSEFIEDVGNGWFRCGIVFDSDAVDTSINCEIWVAEADNDFIVDLDDTSSILCWGADLQAGAFPTSYIATTTTSETRDKDVINTTDMSWFNEPAGTFYLSSSIPVDTDALATWMNVDDGSASDRFIWDKKTTDESIVTILATTGNGAVLTGAATSYTAGVTVRISTAYAQDDVEHYVDGVRAQTGDQDFTPPTGITILRVGGNLSDSQQPNGHIAEIRYYDIRKDNQFLEDLSNGIFHEMRHTSQGKRHNRQTMRHQDTSLEHLGDRRHLR